MKYCCSYCGKSFDSEDECKSHERGEIKLHPPKDAVICPSCNGKGWCDGTDGIDCSECYICDGIGWVIPTTKTVVTYNKIL